MCCGLTLLPFYPTPTPPTCPLTSFLPSSLPLRSNRHDSSFTALFLQNLRILLNIALQSGPVTVSAWSLSAISVRLANNYYVLTYILPFQGIWNKISSPENQGDFIYSWLSKGYVLPFKLFYFLCFTYKL